MADKGSVTGKIAHYIRKNIRNGNCCFLYTSDAADEL